MMETKLVNSQAKLKHLEVQIKQSRELLQQARTRRESLKIEKDLLLAEEAKVNKQMNTLEKSIASFKDDIKRLAESATRNDTLLVSEHAILRYIERVYNIDIEKLKDEILSKDVLLYHSNFGDGKFPHQNGRVVVRDNTVVTFESSHNEGRNGN